VVRPYLQIATGSVIAAGLLGGWAGSHWMLVLVIFGALVISIVWIGRLARLRGVQPRYVYLSAAINLLASALIVAMTGGARSPFWLLFLIGALASAMSYSGKSGAILDGCNAAAAALAMLAPELLGRSLDGPEVGLVLMEVATLYLSGTAVRKIMSVLALSGDSVRNSEQRFRTLIESGFDGLTLLDRKGNILYYSPSNERITGYTSEERTGQTGLALVHPDDRERIATGLRAMAQQPGATNTGIYRIRHKDGSWRWVEGIARNLLAEPSVNAVVVNVRDVTERTLAEQKLRESEQEYRHLYATAQRQTQELALLDKIREAVARELEITNLFRTVVESIAETFGYTQVSLYLLEGESLVLQHQVGYEDVISTIPITQGITGRVVRTGQPVLLEDAHIDPDFLGAIEGIASEVCVPLLDGGGPVGILNIESTQGTRLSESDLRLMLAVVEHVNVAIGRARTHTEIQKREEQYRSLFENSPVGIGVVDRSGKFLAFNDAILRPGGYSKEDILELGTVEALYYDPADRQGVLTTLRAQGTVTRYPVKFKRKDGSPYDTLLTLAPATLNGEPALQALVEDISKQTQAETSSREHEERYRLVAETATDGMIMIDENSQILFVNPAAEQIFGYTTPELLGQPLSRLMPENRRADHLRSLRDLIETGERHISWKGITLQGLHKDGHLIPLEISFGELLRAGRHYFIGIVRDITERERSEQALRESEAKYHRLIEHIPAITYTAATDDAKTRLYVSPQIETMLGISQDEYLADSDLWHRMIHPADRERVLAAAERFYATGEPFVCEYRSLTRDGNGLWFHDEAVIVRDGAGSPPFIQGVKVDITERKDGERRLQRQLAELSTLHAISITCSQSNSENEMIEQVAKSTARIYSEVCGILLLNERGDVLTPHPSYIGADVSNWYAGYPITEGVTGKAVSTGRVMRIGDVTEEPGYFEIASGIKSELCVPIRVNERIIGVLNVESHEAERFDEDDERFLGTVAGTLGNSIQRLRLFQTEERRRAEAETLQESSAVMATSLDWEQAIDLILDQLARVLSYDSASVQLLRGGFLEIVGGRGWLDPDVVLGKRFEVPGENPNSKVIRERRAIILGDAPLAYALFREEPHSHIRSWLGVPLIAQNQVIGMLAIDSRQADYFTEAHVRLVTAFAHQAAAAIENARLFRSLQQAHMDLAWSYDTTLEGWGNALELRDKETQGHTTRVAELALGLAHRVGCTEEELRSIRRGALVHDIGKMGISDRILNKPGPLTKKEWDEMRRHPQYAYDMLYPIAYLRPALDIPYSHHERWDGSGYPHGLKGRQIPLAARIFAVVDVWDALLSDRPYRRAWNRRKAVRYIRENAGTHFDPDIAAIFLKMIGERRQRGG